jgi:hypothetical protein
LLRRSKSLNLFLLIACRTRSAALISGSRLRVLRLRVLLKRD